MRSIFAGCVGLFLRISKEKKIKVSLRKCLKVVGVKVLEGDKLNCIREPGLIFTVIRIMANIVEMNFYYKIHV